MKHWIGLMSGTSLDGLDIVAVSFDLMNKFEKFKLHFSETISYPKTLHDALQNAPLLSTEKLLVLDKTFAQAITTITRTQIKTWVIFLKIEGKRI